MMEPETTRVYADSVHTSISALSWGLPLLIISLAFILILMRQKRWEEFAARRKWSARIILFLLIACFSVPLKLTYNWGEVLVPGKLEFEKPFLTSTAIKLGTYGLVWGHELMSQLPDDKQGLAKCIEAVSLHEAQIHYNDCGDSSACIETLPAMSREVILDKIKASQKTSILPVSTVCKNIDVTKL